MNYVYSLYVVIAVLTAISAWSFAANVRAVNKLAQVRREFAKYQAQASQATLALIAAAEEEMERTARATLKKAHTVEKATGLTIGQVFGSMVGGDGPGLSERDVVAAALAQAIKTKIEGAGLGEFAGGFDGGFADGGPVFRTRPESWNQDGVKYTKDNGLTSGEFDWGPGEPIPASLPEGVQEILRGLQAEHDAQAKNEGSGGYVDPGETRHHYDAPDSDDLQAQKAASTDGAKPLTETPTPRTRGGSKGRTV